MIFGNVLRNKTYPVSVSSERTFQALAIVRYAKEIGADGLAHGSTGAGNDQVRFDLCFLTANGISVQEDEAYVFDMHIGTIKKEVQMRSRKSILYF